MRSTLLYCLSSVLSGCTFSFVVVELQSGVIKARPVMSKRKESVAEKNERARERRRPGDEPEPEPGSAWHGDGSGESRNIKSVYTHRLSYCRFKVYVYIL